MIARFFLFAILFWLGVPLTAAAGTVGGDVRDQTGRPVDAATVYAQSTTRMDGRRHRFAVRTDAEGIFSIPNLTPDTYEVHAYKESDGYADTFFAFYGINERAWSVIQVGTTTATNVKLVLGPKCGRLKLRIQTQNGQMVTGAVKLARMAAPESVVSIGVSSDSSILVPPVPFKFQVLAEGCELWTSKVITLKPGGILELTVNLTVQR